MWHVAVLVRPADVSVKGCRPAAPPALFASRWVVAADPPAARWPPPRLQKTVFYAALSPLLAFYVLFTAVLYPMHPSLHLNGFYAATASLVPAGLHGLLKGEEQRR